jgi:hypothetical protein
MYRMFLRRHSRLVSVSVIVIAVGFVMVPPAFSQDFLVGTWTATITIPSGPGSQQMVTSTVTFNVGARGKSLVGRMTITDDQNRIVAGVWREVGKSISITYEPVCDPASSSPCGTLLLIGKVKPATGTIKGTRAIVMWDTKNSQNPSLYDTSNGSFSAQIVNQ